MNIRDNQRDFNRVTLGIGYGQAVSVHKRLDLKWEVRVGYADNLWSQLFIGINLKVEKWIKDFSKKIPFIEKL